MRATRVAGVRPRARTAAGDTAMAAAVREVTDLILPVECAGCGRGGVGWCAACDACVREGPVPVRPRVDPGVPVWSTGAYVGPRRAAVIAVKDRGRRDLSRPLGSALANAVASLRAAGELDPPELSPLVLVPAPTRAAAARRRGGDPVSRVTGVAARSAPGAVDARMLRLRPGVRDSVGLGVAERERNLAGRIVVRRRPRTAAGAMRSGSAGGGRASAADAEPTTVFVDDVVTTGTTAAESVRALAAAGIPVHAALVLAHA